MSDLHIGWDTGQMTLHLQEWLPVCTQKDMRKVCKMIREMDWRSFRDHDASARGTFEQLLSGLDHEILSWKDKAAAEQLNLDEYRAGHDVVKTVLHEKEADVKRSKKTVERMVRLKMIVREASGNV